MKAKKSIPEKSEQPNPLPAPFNHQTQERLAPWQEKIVALGEALLSVNDTVTVLANAHRRALGLCRIVDDLSLAEHQSEISLNALGEVMEAAEESIHIAMWITTGKDGRFEF